MIERFFNPEKGRPHYLREKRNKRIALTAGLFALTLIVLLTGIMMYGSRKNLLTIVAIVGCLPACKFLVEVILLAMHRGYDGAEALASRYPGLPILFDYVFPTEKKHLPVDALVIRGGSIIGYSSGSEEVCREAGEYLKGFLTKNRVKNCNVTVFSSEEKFKDRLDQLHAKSTGSEEPDQNREAVEQYVKSLIDQIAL